MHAIMGFVMAVTIPNPNTAMFCALGHSCGRKLVLGMSQNPDKWAALTDFYWMAKMAAVSTDVENHLDTERSALRRWLTRWQAHLGFTFGSLAIGIGWWRRDTLALTAEEGLGYFLGFVAVTCMLILLGYPFRKRVPLFRFLGKTKDWFRTHMIMGALATITALYHCNFQVGSLNSRIALFSVLLVGGSGVIGRFLYAKIHRGLYGRRMTLKELLSQIRLTKPEGGQVVGFMPELMARIADFDRQVLVPPKGILDTALLPFRLSLQTRVATYQLIRFSKRSLKQEAAHSPIVKQHRRKLARAIKRYVRTHLSQVRKVAGFTAYERLFALWHKVHLPFFFLLIVSTIIHIVAVHLY